MASLQEFYSHLKSILKLLQEEKDALLHNDGFKIAMIVESKNEYIEKLSQFKGLDINENKKAMGLIEEINSFQEVNLLLTKQALSFQNVLLESIAKNVHNMSNTYSSKGKYGKLNDIGLIDHSV